MHQITAVFVQLRVTDKYVPQITQLYSDLWHKIHHNREVRRVGVGRWGEGEDVGRGMKGRGE